MNYIKILLSLFVAYQIVGCSLVDNDKTVFKADIIGKAGDLLVVMNNDVKRDTCGGFILSMFSQPCLGLPSYEPMYNALTVPKAAFDGQMRNYRTLLFVEINDTIKTDTVRFAKDVWAKPQAVITASASSKAQMLKLMERNEVKILSFIAQEERSRIVTYNKRITNMQLADYLRNQWNISISVPTGYNKNKCADDFSWFSMETPVSSKGMFIYSFPYVGEGTFSKEYLLNKRDSLLHFNVEGPEGSFMCTELRSDIVYFKGKYNDMPVVELRGLWRTQGYMMGGPFLLRAIHDVANNRVLVTDGYVYFPAKDEKRNMIRELEGIMHTVQILPNDATNPKN